MCLWCSLKKLCNSEKKKVKGSVEYFIAVGGDYSVCRLVERK